MDYHMVLIFHNLGENNGFLRSLGKRLAEVETRMLRKCLGVQWDSVPCLMQPYGHTRNVPHFVD